MTDKSNQDRSLPNRTAIAWACALLAIAGVAIVTLGENPYELALESVASERGWHRAEIELLSGETRGVGGIHWTSVKFLLSAAGHAAPVTVTAHKVPFFPAAASCYSVDKSCDI